MQYTLMHADHPVMELTFSQDGAQIMQIGAIHAPERIPVGLRVPLRRSLDHWWHRRAVPESRPGLLHALRVLHLHSPEELLTQCRGMSLSDAYWIRPAGEEVTWEESNFFSHDFSEHVGNVLLGRETAEEPAFPSPDGSLDGWLPKKWTIRDGRRCLLKGASGFWSEPFGEVIAFAIAGRLGIAHASCDVVYEGQYRAPMSLCENFLEAGQELVPASAIARVLERRENEDKFSHFCRCCEALGIPEYRERLEEMLVLDYLIANQDRHKGNFGALRDAGTLAFTGMAPLYDNGASLRYDTPDAYIDPHQDVEAMPFRSFHEEQIRLVEHPERFDLTALHGIDEEIRALLADPQARAFIPEARAEKIVQVVTARIQMLQKHWEAYKG